MAYHYYIYYRVNPEHAETFAAKIHELIAEVRQTTGVAGRTLRKRGEPDLWMEIYEGVADEAKFEWELAEAVARLKLQELLQEHTTRHIECFHD
jgi:quinol monooxygenase YgiN